MSEDLTDLHRDFGELKGTVSALSREVTALRVEVTALTAALNQARGAKYVIFLIPGIVGAAAAFLAYFGLKASFGN
jgi:hypothetical protein